MKPRKKDRDQRNGGSKITVVKQKPSGYGVNHSGFATMADAEKSAQDNKVRRNTRQMIDRLEGKGAYRHIGPARS